MQVPERQHLKERHVLQLPLVKVFAPHGLRKYFWVSRHNGLKDRQESATLLRTQAKLWKFGSSSTVGGELM